MTKTTTAVVAGAIANTAHRGGDTWHRLHWLLGLRRLGLRVHFIEVIDEAVCVDADAEAAPVAKSVNLAYFVEVLRAFGLDDSATLLTGSGDTVYGLPQDETRRLLGDADLFINISGHLPWHDFGARPRRAVFIDEDPGFTQIWHAMGTGPRLDGYDYYFTVGANIGTPQATVPLDGIAWRPLRPFVVLDCWPETTAEQARRFTTVGSWRGPFGPLSFGGIRYGAKAHEFRKFSDLPRLTARSFELALDMHPADRHDRELLLQRGWHLVNPRQVAGDPHAFRTYVQESGAEFSVAKGMYVQTNSGWFSDRTIRYLASGRPALVQDTGFTTHYRAQEGLVTFTTMADAIEGVARIWRDYEAHSQAARGVAERYFNSDDVLGQLVDETEVRL